MCPPAAARSRFRVNTLPDMEGGEGVRVGGVCSRGRSSPIDWCAAHGTGDPTPRGLPKPGVGRLRAPRVQNVINMRHMTSFESLRTELNPVRARCMNKFQRALPSNSTTAKVPREWKKRDKVQLITAHPTLHTGREQMEAVSL